MSNDDNDRLTIVEMEYRIATARLSTIEAELALIVRRLANISERLGHIEDRLDGYDERFSTIDATMAEQGSRLIGVERGVTALLRHFKISDQ